MQADLENFGHFIDSASHPWFATLISAAVVVVVLLLAHLLVHRVLMRITRRAPMLHALVRMTNSPVALLMPTLGLAIVFGLAPDDLPMIALVRHATTLVLIVALTWTGLRTVAAISDGVMIGFADGDTDIYRKRRVQTQTRVLTRILKFLVVLLGAAMLLMTFPSVRQIGASMLASAGLAGIVIGFAARPVLENLLAGLQIAITQPIRIDDVVIVEGEWGWIEHIYSTYVVVRIWDQRRLVVPLNYFIATPFQNWTRDSSELIGAVTWWVDYRMPLQPLRDELQRLCETAPEWDGRVQLIQVVDSSDRAMQIRALVSAADAPLAWDLRCRIREGLIDFFQREYPQYLPQVRSELVSDEKPGALAALGAADDD